MRFMFWSLDILFLVNHGIVFFFFNFLSQANLLLSGRRRSSPAQEPIALVTKEQHEQRDHQHQAGLLAPKEPTNQGDHQAGLVVNKEETNQQVARVANHQVSTGLISKEPPLTIDTSPPQALNPLQPPNNVRHLESSTKQLPDKASPSSRNIELSTTQDQELESASCALKDKVGPNHTMSLS